MPDCYIALLRQQNGEYLEPDPATGYARVNVGSPANAVNAIACGSRIVFDDSEGSGYGDVTHYGLIDAETEGHALSIVPLQEPVTVPTGVVPVFHKGRLLLGVDLAMQISASSCSQMKL